MPRQLGFISALLIGVAAVGCVLTEPRPTPPDVPSNSTRTEVKRPWYQFDPRPDSAATKIEIIPLDISNPVRSQRLVIATVADSGGAPRRRRQVDWQLDGVGHIVEVDLTGSLTGGGRK